MLAPIAQMTCIAMRTDRPAPGIPVGANVADVEIDGALDRRSAMRRG